MKLQFLAKLLQPGSRLISSYIFTAAAKTDPWNVSIIQQCRMLENNYYRNKHCSFMLENPEAAVSILKVERKNLYERDYACLIEKKYARPDSFSFFIAFIAKETTWQHLRDLALDRGTKGMQ